MDKHLTEDDLIEKDDFELLNKVQQEHLNVLQQIYLFLLNKKNKFSFLKNKIILLEIIKPGLVRNSRISLGFDEGKEILNDFLRSFKSK